MNRLLVVSSGLVMIYSLLSPLTTLAQAPAPTGVGLNFSFDKVEQIRDKAGVKKNEGNLPYFITTILKVVLSFVGILAAAAIIYASILLITNLGDEDSVAKAKKIILYAVIGLILIGFSVVIVNFVINEFVLKQP